MKCSVIVPCYNVAPWVGEALKSVAAQTLPPHEIICIDDGSTDGTLDAIRASAVNVKLLQTPHVNAAAARNAGIAAATGDWIAFQDADDLWYPQHLERAAALLADSKSAAYLSLSDSLRPDGRTTALTNPWPIDAAAGGLTHEQFITVFSAKSYFSVPGMLVRREVLLAVGGFDPTQTRLHDIDLWLRCIHQRTWAYDPAPSTCVRVGRSGSLTTHYASREYFFLRALLKNRALYVSPAMDEMIHRYARRAVSGAIMDGDEGDRARAKELAWAHLRPYERGLFGVANLFPWAFRTLNGVRRRVLGLPHPTAHSD